MLKVKKRNSQNEWIEAYKRSILSIDVKRADSLIRKAIERIPKGKSIYGWSGGKDALVLQVVCEEAGIKDCVFGTIGEQWEWPSFWDFVCSHLPAGCYVENQNLSDSFMIQHENLVFPETSDDAYEWYKICNQSSYYNFAKQTKADNILLGHRTIDGNNCKSTRNGKVYPIADFSHEDVFCVLAAKNIRLPEIYFYPNGFFNGTHAWIMRGGRSAINEVADIDRSLLEAHKDIPKINKFLKEN